MRPWMILIIKLSLSVLKSLKSSALAVPAMLIMPIITAAKIILLTFFIFIHPFSLKIFNFKINFNLKGRGVSTCPD